MSKAKVTLVPLEDADRNQFVLDNQEAFKYGATEEFGMRDNHFEEEGEISHATPSSIPLMAKMPRPCPQ